MIIEVSDIGYGYVKGTRAKVEGQIARVENFYSFPSFVRRVQNAAFGIAEHEDYIEYQGNSYLVGKAADELIEETRVRDPDIYLKRLPIFLTRVRKVFPEEPDILILGTPFQEWKRLTEEIVNTGKNYAKEVYCFPQAAGAAVRFVVKKNTLVIDIGFNTVDIVPLDNTGKVLADRGISFDKYGVSRILHSLRNLTKSHIGIGTNISPLLFERILLKPSYAKRVLPVNNEFYEKIVIGLLDEYSQNLFNMILDRFSGMFEQIILVGGGARIIGKSFKRKAIERKIPIKIPPAPELANVMGFLALGLSKAGFRGQIEWPEGTSSQKKKADKKEENKENKEREEDNG